MIPARTISAEYAAWCKANPMTAAVEPLITLLTLNSKNAGPNGTPTANV